MNAETETLGAGLFLRSNPKSTVAKIFGTIDRSWLYAMESEKGLPHFGSLEATGALGVAIWPKIDGWIPVRDTERTGPGFGVRPEERITNRSYQHYEAGIRWSLPGLLSNYLTTTVLWYREVTPQCCLLMQLEVGGLVDSVIVSRDELRERMAGLGAPDPATYCGPGGELALGIAKVAMRTFARFARAPYYASVPSDEQIQRLALFQVALASGDSSAIGLFLGLAKEGALDPAVPWFSRVDSSRPQVRTMLQEMTRAAASDPDLPSYYRGLMTAHKRRRS